MFASFHKHTSSLLFFFIFLINIHLQIINGVYNFSSMAADADDRLALMAIKSEIQHDPQGVMMSWNESLHFCQWQGVICGRRHKRVTFLDLSSKGLVGSLSPYIGNMSFLRDIQLQNNTFEGGIPPELGRLHRLELLQLFNNSFEGEIPSNLSQCSHLLFLELGNNKLVGRIPREFTSLIMLRILSLYHNELIGRIPPFIGNLTSLRILYLDTNKLGGTVPDAFHQLKNLQILYLYDNDLVGTIPPSIYHIPMLKELDISINQLQGSLPKNIGSMLPLLRRFYVYTNRLTGPLPPSISNLSQLEEIDLGGNNFTGKIAINFGSFQNLLYMRIAKTMLGSGEPDEMKFIDSLSNCSSLEKLLVGGNHLTGVLPASLGNFSVKLDWLSLASNFLYGSIPSSIGNLISLTFLSLSDNQFTGIIPTSIGKLQNLHILLVDTNDFFGEIPGSMGNLSALLELYMSLNRFEGNIPTSLGNCRNLITLSLYQNKLSGSIPRELFSHMPLSILLALGRNNLSGPVPTEIGNLKGTTGILLAENNLSGELPSSLASCTSLELLDLSMNSFQGSIPTSFRSLRGLLELDLSSNNFSGHIPSFLEDIPLQYLNLSFNNFEGEIPMGGVFSNSSVFSFVGNSKLCGGMPELGLPKCNSKKDQKEPRHKSSSLATILSITIFTTLAGATSVSFFLFRWCTKKKKHQLSPSSLKESLEKVSYQQLLKATQGFSPTNLIGAGGFASVYRGMLGENGGVNVAVKVVNLGRQGGPKSFVAECEALRKIRHRNLVKVITCCSSLDFQGNDFKAIICEYMENGSLERWLHSSTDPEHGLHYLSLRRRISVANDVACAFDYLHHHCGETIVHCDLKPSNILFDGDMVAHIGDFGLAKFLQPGVSNPVHSSSVGIRGTIGYAAPEYGLGSEVSTKGDIYSFGILLLEMVTGKKPVDPMFEEGLNLHGYAKTALAHHRVLDIVDPTILQDDGADAATTIVRNNESIKEASDYKQKEECCTLLLRIGVACSLERPEDRMDITNVVHELKLLCKYQF